LVVSFLVNHPSTTVQEIRSAVGGAAVAGQLRVLKLLLSISHPDASSSKLIGDPLWTAAAYGHVAAMQLLVQHGADVNSSVGSPWSWDRTENDLYRFPLCIAAFNGHHKAVSWLSDQGVTTQQVGAAFKSAAMAGRADVVPLLLSHKHAWDAIASHGAAALLTALERRHITSVKLLLEAGVPSDKQALAGAGVAPDMSMVQTWIRNAVLAHKPDASSALLQAAVQHGHTEFAEMLRESGAGARCA
jgi:ankyrin repeat protein